MWSLLRCIAVLCGLTLALNADAAHADTCAERCAALRIKIARANHRRAGFEIRGELALRTLTRRVNRDLATVGSRITQAERLVVRATGTPYEARARWRLDGLTLRRQAIIVTARRRANRLSTALQSALHRIDARIARFREDAATHGCPVEPSA